MKTTGRTCFPKYYPQNYSDAALIPEDTLFDEPRFPGRYCGPTGSYPGISWESGWYPGPTGNY